MNTTSDNKPSELLEEEIKYRRSILLTDRLDMSFGEIMNMYQAKELVIAPKFQRLFRWTDYQKTRLIESILLGIPVPPIFVAEDKEGAWELVDGLQRISTILSFFGLLEKDGKLDNHQNNWSLVEGDLIKSLKFLTKDDLSLRQQRTIKTAVCRVEILRWLESQSDIKYELFNRLNTGGTPATEQEIRNAIFRGKSDNFNNFLKKLSNKPDFQAIIKPTEKQIEELYVEELVLRFIALYDNKEEDINENISAYMTKYMKKAVDNEQYPYEHVECVFNETVNILKKLGLQDKLFKGNKGPLSNNLYDIIVFGTSKNINIYKENINLLKDKIEQLKNSSELKNTSSQKINSMARTAKRIELANNIFGIE